MASLLDLVDLKIPKNCRVRFDDKEIDLIAFKKTENKIYAIAAGGSRYEINQETYQLLDKKLDEHLRKFFYNK